MGELTQVLTDDVQEIDGILCLIISATSGDGKRLKTEVSHRVILRQHHRRGERLSLERDRAGPDENAGGERLAGRRGSRP